MKKKNKLAGLQKRKAISGYFFILPFIFGFLVFMVKPMAQSFYMSMCNVEITTSGVILSFTKLANYIRAITIDPEFNRTLIEEIGRMFVNTIAIMVFSFFMALLLNQKFKGRAMVRAIFFLPVILTSGIILGLEYDNTLLAGLKDTIQENTNTASVTDAIKQLITTMGIGNSLFKVVFDIVDQVYDIAIASGIQIIIFLSGLQTISEGMYEAAAIEGCTAWESLWKITFPMTSSLLLVNWIYTIIDFCMRSDNAVMERIDSVMNVQLNYGFASSLAWIYFIVVIVIIGISSLIISKAVYYYE